MDRSSHDSIVSRRTALQAGTIGMLGLGMNHLQALRAGSTDSRSPRAESVIYIFLTGGLSQHDTFDMNPDAPENIRGEFQTIATNTPGLRICGHLPMFAGRSDRWSLVRSLMHPNTSHEHGHTIMLTGRTQLPPGYRPRAAQATDWPGIAAVAGEGLRLAGRAALNNLPPAIVVPESLRLAPAQPVPGQMAGSMGAMRDPWVIDASPHRADTSWGAPTA